MLLVEVFLRWKISNINQKKCWAIIRTCRSRTWYEGDSIDIGKKTNCERPWSYFGISCTKEFDADFADSKTVNNDIWGKIASQLNEMGYYLRTDQMRAREKYGQKWSNLQTCYIKYNDKIKSTGEGYVKTPPIF